MSRFLLFGKYHDLKTTTPNAKKTAFDEREGHHLLVSDPAKRESARGIRSGPPYRHESQLPGVDHRLNPVFRLKLGENGVVVSFDRRFFEAQFFGNFPIGQTLIDQFQHLEFPRSEGLVPAVAASPGRRIVPALGKARNQRQADPAE